MSSIKVVSDQSILWLLGRALNSIAFHKVALGHGGAARLFQFCQTDWSRHSAGQRARFRSRLTCVVQSGTVRAGNVTVADGTSASTPVFAGIVARLNAARFAAGKSALGFLNPWLYSLKGSGFSDITEGNNGCYEAGACCAEDLPPPQRGFHAVSGWDPASGWGSPIWEELLAAALSR
jgi:hypothetical protein